MQHGERLTEYTSFEIQVLLNALARETDYVNALGADANSKYRDAISQWKTKIIEAKTEVRLKEIQTEN